LVQRQGISIEPSFRHPPILLEPAKQHAGFAHRPLLRRFVVLGSRHFRQVVQRANGVDRDVQLLRAHPRPFHHAIAFRPSIFVHVKVAREVTEAVDDKLVIVIANLVIAGPAPESFTTIENEIRDEAEIAAQSAAFEQHLELAAATGKSVVIHQRDSWEDTIEILRKYPTRVRAVMHGFDAGLAQAQEAVDLGHFVSFTGIVTFENTSEVREAAKSVPIERIMVESDSPFLAPAPYRGKRSEPAFVRETAAFIANLRGMSLAEFAAQTTQNAQRFFEFNT
jgi:TatD family hydrolase